MADITLENVTKIYPGDVKAVDNISLHVEHGQFLVLLGPSGCGKTTTLRLIAGLERPDSGKVLIGGEIVNDVPPQHRNVAVVFQSYALYPHMTVAQNMGFGLKMRGTPSSEIRKHVVETSRLLGLEELLSRFPRQLSGGQRQRVALGRAIVRDPAVFLLDEPLSNLDALLRAETRVELQKLQHRLNGTFVFVTHDQIEAMTLAQVIAVICGGKIHQIGPPREFYEKPKNLFVAGFVGSPKMNFISGSIVRGGDGILLRTDVFTLPIPERLPSLRTMTTQGSIVVGIRPADIRVSSSENGLSNAEMVVEAVEMTGSQQFVYGPAGEPAQQLIIGVDPEMMPKVGERVSLRFAAEKMHFFDAKSGDRLPE